MITTLPCNQRSVHHLPKELHMVSIILLGKQQKYVFHWWQDPLRAYANKQP